MLTEQLEKVDAGSIREMVRGMAEYLCRNQSPNLDDNPAAGSIPAYINSEISREVFGQNWNHAFGIMALLSAAKWLNEPRYEAAALRMARYLKTLQIFDPFKKEHYGAIRERTPQTPWCFPRDTISAGWAFVELYRYTGDKEYLERACLLGEWFINHALDEEGWPYWGIQFEPFFEDQTPAIHNDLQGSFQGGSLGFFYQLAAASSDNKWVGRPFVKIADFLVAHIQQESGYFLSVRRDTKQPPEDDPVKTLHRGNDDLCSLGLLCAYRITGDQKYLKSIQRFLNAVCAVQKDGAFDSSTIASIPVILNILYEASGLVTVDTLKPDCVSSALELLKQQQSKGLSDSRTAGGLLENPGIDCVHARSTCYAMIVLSKIFGHVKGYLTS